MCIVGTIVLCFFVTGPPGKKGYMKKDTNTLTHIHTLYTQVVLFFINMSISSVSRCSKTSGLLHFSLSSDTVMSRTLQFCREEFVVQSYDIDEYGNILLFLLDNETIVKVNVGRSAHKDFQCEVSVMCLCGDVDSMSLFAEVFFDLHNAIADLVVVI